MEAYEVIVVNAKGENHYALGTKYEEAERYMYGRYFYLGSQDGEVGTDMFFLVESHYADQIIPRMASGLIWARKSTFEERSALGLAS